VTFSISLSRPLPMLCRGMAPSYSSALMAGSAWSASRRAPLTSLYEVSFSGANIQRLNLTNRMAEIREGATGFSSQLSVNRQPLPMGKEGKGAVEETSVLQTSPENRWGVFASGDGDFVSVGGDGNASGYDFTTAGVTLGVDYRADCPVNAKGTPFRGLRWTGWACALRFPGGGWQFAVELLMVGALTRSEYSISVSTSY
jgi:hypothetical protein